MNTLFDVFGTVTKKNIYAFALISIALLFAGAMPWLFASFNNNGNFYGLYIDKPAQQFNLVDTHGKSVTLGDLKGSYVYLMFGFSNCKEVCPLQVHNLNQVNNLIKDDNVRFVFISLDPERDTAELLKTYFEAYGNNFMALRPVSFTESQSLAHDYHEYAYRTGQPKEEYEINHNGYIFLLDPQGVMKFIYTSTRLNHAEMYQDLQKLIN